MKQFKVILAVVFLIASISILVVLLFSPRPIQIVLETGQEVTSKSAEYFTIGSVMVFIICSFLIGSAITYLFYNADAAKALNGGKEKPQAAINSILPLLRDDERRAVIVIHEHHGEILQNKLVLQLGQSKVKTTRILASLERKGIVQKHRHGLTNSVRLTVGAIGKER